ncbi:hypothetical protein EDC01DRAFT_644136 [Geopyxis carbonaria]|nr:hypothetical protein EDC01DRAFT_644136 [Geopyxis carbonaria]
MDTISRQSAPSQLRPTISAAKFLRELYMMVEPYNQDLAEYFLAYSPDRLTMKLPPLLHDISCGLQFTSETYIKDICLDLICCCWNFNEIKEDLGYREVPSGVVIASRDRSKCVEARTRLLIWIGPVNFLSHSVPLQVADDSSLNYHFIVDSNRASEKLKHKGIVMSNLILTRIEAIDREEMNKVLLDTEVLSEVTSSTTRPLGTRPHTRYISRFRELL